MDKHEIAKASAEIGLSWMGVWFGWGSLLLQWLQIGALLLTIVFTVLRIRALVRNGREQ